MHTSGELGSLLARVADHDDLAHESGRQEVWSKLFGQSAPRQRLGRFELIRSLGRGGMGEVFAAHDPELDRRVAIKVISHACADQMRERFAREGRALARLSHPNIVQIYEVGHHEGSVFIAMELVEGRTLRRWVVDESSGSRRSHREILRVYLEAGRGLAAAHAVGLVHRDFKPDNAMVGSDGRTRVLDFGLARALTGAEDHDDSETTAEAHSDRLPSIERLTVTGAVMGTPAYMPPEQIRGRAVTAASDQFSFCVALWEALHGSRPFLGRTLHELHESMTHGRFASTRGTKVPTHVRRVLERGLAYAPEDRFPTMLELLAALQRRGRGLRSWLLGLTGVVVVGAIALTQADDHAGCGAEIDTSSTWSAARLQAIRAAFLRTELPYASSAADATIDGLGTYVDELGRARDAVCGGAEATPPALLQDQLDCLRNRVTFLDALTGSFAIADPATVERSVDVVAELPPIARCVVVTDDPSTSGRSQLHRRIADAKAARLTGHAARATELLHGVIEQAGHDHDPLAEVDARLERASARFDLGELGGARDDLLAAIGRATSARLDERAALAWVELAVRGGRDLRNLDDTPRWLEQARAWVERTGLRGQRRRLDLADAHLAVLSDPKRALERFGSLIEQTGDTAEDPIASQARSGRAAAALDLGRYDDAKDDYLWLLAWRRPRYGDGHPKTIAVYHGLGIALDRSGELDAASDAYERALAGWRALHPSGHPEIARVLIALASVDLARGDVRMAHTRAEEALGLQRRLAPEDVALAEALTLMGVVQHVAGELEAAVRSHEAALRIYEMAFGTNDAHAAIARSNMAEAMLMSGRPKQAIPQLTEALRVLESVLGTEHPWHSYPLKGLGIAALIEDRPLEALAFLERARALSGPDPAERAEIALALRHARRATDASPGDELERPDVDDELVRARLDRLQALLSP